jgi:Zn-dependent protease
MSDGPPLDDAERRARNLRAVLRHHAANTDKRDAEPGRDARNEGAWKRRLAVLGPVGVAAIFVLGKLKFLLPLLKFTKLGTLLTMFVSIWAYALFFGLPFALGFVLLIFVHELGHGLVMQRMGIRAGAPVFIPFVGAVIAMKSLPRDAYVEALVGIGGPVLGSAGALACLAVAWITGSPLWYALAHTGFWLNMVNLIPISPLDGGRIVGVVSRWLWLAGYAVGIGAFLVTRSPMLLLILLLGLFSLGRTLRGHHEDYFRVAAGKRVAIGAAYFVLLALLAVGMRAADEPLEAIRDPGRVGSPTGAIQSTTRHPRSGGERYVGLQGRGPLGRNEKQGGFREWRSRSPRNASTARPASRSARAKRSPRATGSTSSMPTCAPSARKKGRASASWPAPWTASSPLLEPHVP